MATLPRKHRWTVIGAALLALLALAAQFWFPPARPGVEAPTAEGVRQVQGSSRR